MYMTWIQCTIYNFTSTLTTCNFSLYMKINNSMKRVVKFYHVILLMHISLQRRFKNISGTKNMDYEIFYFLFIVHRYL